MALNARQRWMVLGGLLTLTLLASFWGDDGGNNASTVVAPAKRGTRSEGARRVEHEQMLSLALLKRAPAEGKPDDAFAAKSWYVPPPVPKALAPSTPMPPSMPFTYIGRMVDDGKTTVFLTRGDRSYAAKVGDTVDSMYRVDAIDLNGVTLTYLPLNMQQTLATGGLK